MFSSNPQRVQHGSETNNHYEGSTTMETHEALHVLTVQNNNQQAEVNVESNEAV